MMMRSISEVLLFPVYFYFSFLRVVKLLGGRSKDALLNVGLISHRVSSTFLLIMKGAQVQKHDFRARFLKEWFPPIRFGITIKI